MYLLLAQRQVRSTYPFRPLLDSPPVAKKSKKRSKPDGVMETFMDKMAETKVQIEAMKNEMASKRMELLQNKQRLEERKLEADILASKQAADIARFHMLKELGFSNEKMVELLGLPSP